MDGELRIGAGWQALVDELRDRAAALAPRAGLRVGFDDLGLLSASFDGPETAAMTDLLREFHSRALATCEVCGGRGSVRAGVVIRVRCGDCD